MFVLPLSHAVSRRVLNHRTFDRLLDESLDRFFGAAPGVAAPRTPAMDVSESDTTFTIRFDMPGVAKEQLQVTVEGRRVSVETAEAAEAPAADGKEAKDADRALYRERAAVRYARTVVLPTEVDQAASQARLDNGVLTLTLTKKVPAGALRIAVN